MNTKSEPTLPPAALVVMGVSGSGKSTVADQLSRRLGWVFRDGDSFHPAANIAKMSRGMPLTDEDRLPWLTAIADWIGSLAADGRHGIVACSALRRRYRDILVGGHPDRVRFVFLDGTRELIRRRLAARRDHFMPPALLDSQFATLERPGADEDVIAVSIDASAERIVDQVLAEMERAGGPH